MPSTAIEAHLAAPWVFSRVFFWLLFLLLFCVGSYHLHPLENTRSGAIVIWVLLTALPVTIFFFELTGGRFGAVFRTVPPLMVGASLYWMHIPTSLWLYRLQWGDSRTYVQGVCLGFCVLLLPLVLQLGGVLFLLNTARRQCGRKMDGMVFGIALGAGWQSFATCDLVLRTGIDLPLGSGAVILNQRWILQGILIPLSNVACTGILGFCIARCRRGAFGMHFAAAIVAVVAISFLERYWWTCSWDAQITLPFAGFWLAAVATCLFFSRRTVLSDTAAYGRNQTDADNVDCG